VDKILAARADCVVLVYSYDSDYSRIKSRIPWRKGIIYGPDVEAGMTVAEGKAFVRAVHADGRGCFEYHSTSVLDIGAELNWLAHYGPTDPPAGSDAWQYYGGISGDTPHTFPGMPGPCDMNLLVAPLSKFKRIAGLDEGGQDVNDTQDAMLRRGWNALAEEADRYGVDRPKDPEEDADAAACI